MSSPRRALPALLAAALLVARSASAQDAAPPSLESPDDQARFLAGLPVSAGSPLAALEQGADWQDYAHSLEVDWTKIRERRLDKMAEWSRAELGPRLDPKANLFYVFGGPDLVSAAVLYPEAPVYILCGLEPIGQVPTLSALKKAALDRAIDNLRRSLHSTVRSSFFKTNDMAGDLTRTELRGVLPLLYLFSARLGAKVLESRPIEIDASGVARDLAPGEKPGEGVPGARLRIQREGREPQEVFYLRLNVENDVVSRTPGFFAFLQRHAPANAFFKAASFILHNPKRFSKTRDFLLENSATILQDDSGMPYQILARSKQWSFVLYGKYLQPLPPFTGHIQEGLAKAFAEGPVQPLPFVTGYRRPGESNLVLALKKAAAPAAPAAPAPAPP